MGHSEGDAVLVCVAQVMLGSLRSSDLVSRYGGDEFVIFLPNTGMDQARDVFTGLKEKLDAAVKPHNWPIGFSVGVCVLDSTKTMPDAAISTADSLMYHVKKQGKGVVLFKDLRAYSA